MVLVGKAITMLNRLISYVKVLIVIVCDLVSKYYNPFTRNSTTYITDLEVIEKRFMEHLLASLKPTGEFKYEDPCPSDFGDGALWNGIYLATLALAGKPVIPTLEMIKRCFFVNGILIRGYDSNLEPNDTTSNDSATGMMFGLYCVMAYGDPAERWTATRLINSWVSNIVQSGLALTDLSGKPTKYGKLENSLLTDPLRLTLLLSLLRLSSEPSSLVLYNKLFKEYRPILKYPKVKLLWLDTDYDTHRAAIHLHVLCMLTGDRVYSEGLKRLWRISKETNNSWVYALCSPAVIDELGLNWLYTFDAEKRLIGNIQSLHPDVEAIKWGKRIRAKQTLPLSERGSQDFFWQRNMFSKDEWIGYTEATTKHTGLDFLVCYWLAKRLELL